MNIGETVCGANAIQTLRELALKIKDFDGVVVEVGVFRGGSGKVLKDTLPDDQIYLFDTFEGMPQENEFDNLHKRGDFADTSYEEVCKLFADSPNVSVYKGCFPQENSDILFDKQVKFLHLDVDIYQSHVDCLEFFHDKMVSGGIIVFDDYNAPTCLGAKKAIDEYASKHGLNVYNSGNYQGFLVFS